MSELELAAADVWATGVSRTAIRPSSCGRTWTRWGAARREAGIGVRRRPRADRRRGDSSAATRHGPGVTFINLEDETGMVNVLCTPGVWARHRKLAHTAPALLIRGQVQNASGAITVVAERMGRLTLAVGARSRDFR